jgi:lipid A 3-O-deacylase
VLSRQLFWMAICAGGMLLTNRELVVGATLASMPSLAAPADSEVRPAPLSGEQFPRGTWDLQVAGAFVRSRTNPRFEQFTGGNVGVGYYFRDRLSIQADVPAYWVNQQQPGVAAGFDLLARWHFYERPRLSVYLDGGAGLLVSQRDIPRTGTRFNFTPQIGIGATWMLDEQTYLFGGARLWHLSNGGWFGHDRNPSVSLAVMGYVGIGWKL